MLKNTSLAFIGSGTMAEAMIKGILNNGLTDPHRIIASGPRPERGRELEERYGVRGTTENQEAAQAGDIVVLSIKPQVLPVVLDELRGLIHP
ncbi:MAG TPA: pyrroline-5-carboxylate reductase, partial [Anaerolineae bacterium]|nr:pyrroline-5-carboxylate reductase [Anaerolineae bacterium]